MKSHLMMPAGLLAMLLTAALSTGSKLMFVLALMVALTVLVSLISVLQVRSALRQRWRTRQSTAAIIPHLC